MRDNDPFQALYEEDLYTALKNDLYNYTIRKNFIAELLKDEEVSLLLEAGSGISPVTNGETLDQPVVYSDISFQALRLQKKRNPSSFFVVADITNLPFRPGTFSHVTCSEVLEHIPDDNEALKELSQVLNNSGNLFLTFPHKKNYFAADDHFVGHLRRYELPEMVEKIKRADLRPVAIRKILGPMDKITMILVVHLFSLLRSFFPQKASSSKPLPGIKALTKIFKFSNLAYSKLIRLDAQLMPQKLASVLFVKAQKTP